MTDAAYIGRLCLALQVGLDRLVLLVELGQVRNKVLNNVGMRKRVNPRFFCSVGRDTACINMSKLAFQRKGSDKEWD